MRLTSTAFKDGASIPDKCTCKGADLSPDLVWHNVPAAAQSLVLILEDPDAPRGTYTHWLAYHIEPAAAGLPAGLKASGQIAEARQGKNDFGKTGYGGPCPPQGHGPHHYHFKLFALDAVPDLPPDADKDAVKAALNGHILAQTELVGIYEVK